MRSAVLNRLLSLCALLLLASAITPAPIQAQQPPPPPPPTTAADQPSSGVAITEATAPPPSAAPSTATPPPLNSSTATVAPAAGATDQATTSVTNSTTQATNSFEIKVEPTLFVYAGGLINYTYTYRNTTQDPINDAMLQAWWNDRDAGSNLLTCSWPSAPTLCVPVSANDQTQPAPGVGPRKDCVAGVQPANSLCYTLPPIGAGETGKFSLLLRARDTIFPQTNRGITVLAGSARIVRVPNPTQADSPDTTNNTTVIGPVLTGTKTAIRPASDPVKGRIYTGDDGTFEFEIGNATGDGDKSNGVIRPDARPANNIIVTDQVPIGSTFVSATAGGTVNPAGTAVVWKFANLNPGQKLPKFQVTFKKIGQSYDRGQCGALRNNSWNVTSDEYPTGEGGKYTIGLSGAELPVVPPVYLQAISYEPNPVLFGDRTRVTITLRNYWPTAVTGVKLNYSLQKNVDFGGSPNPAGSTQEQGQSYQWVNITLPAGGLDTPSDTPFSFDLIAKFDGDTGGNLGVAQFDTTGSNLGARWDCPKTDPYPANIKPRLYIRKYTNSTRPRENFGRNSYLVTPGSEFEYLIDVKNYGTAGEATGVNVTDFFPTAIGAAFTYVAGSSNLQPTVRSDGLDWTIPSIPAGQTVTLRYRLNVQGDDYIEYCNLAVAQGSSPGLETVGTDQGGNQVCVKVSPDIRLTKTVDRKVINLDPDQTDAQSLANRTVRFTLTIKNNEPQPYTANLADNLGYFGFKQSVPVVAPDIDAGTPTLKEAYGNTYYVWPLVTLQPGEIRTAVFDAVVPNICNSATLTNKAVFQNSKYIVNPVPDVTAQVQVNCGRVEYELSADRSTVSLRDRITFTLKLTNKGNTEATGLNVENRMPSGFTYVSMETDSTIKTEPTQAITNTYTTLRWAVPAVAVGKSVYIKYRATSGDAVIQGNQTAEGAWLRLLQNGRCTSNCNGDSAGGPPYSVQNVRVEPLATLEPKIAESGCAKPGDTRSYKLSIVNRNSHAYNATEVSVTLPRGLVYSKVLDATGEPSVVQDGNQQRLVWANQTIAAPQSGQSFVQNDYSVALKVGNTYGALRVLAQALSADGAIPRKEGVVDPTVFVCLDKPLLALNADRSLVKPGGIVTMQIFLANPLSTPYTISIKNVLPPELIFVSYEGGENGKDPVAGPDGLTWNDLTVPVTVGNQYGVVVLNFKVKLGPTAKLGEGYDSIVNVLTKTPSTLTIDTTQNKATIRTAVDTYAPMVNQKR